MSKSLQKECIQNKDAPRTSRITFVSIILAILGVTSVGLFFILVVIQCYFLPSFSDLLGFLAAIVLAIVCPLLFAASFLLGVIGLFVIHFRDKQLKGSHFATAAIILSVVFFSFVLAYAFAVSNVRKVRKEHERLINSFSQVGKAILEYAQDHDGYFPDANQWCDLLIEYDKNLSRETFNPLSDDYECNFAFNKNLSGSRFEDTPNDVVLLFRADGNWNFNGGLELLKTRRERDMWFDVLLVDGSLDRCWLSKNAKFDDPNSCPNLLRWKP